MPHPDCESGSGDYQKGKHMNCTTYQPLTQAEVPGTQPQWLRQCAANWSPFSAWRSTFHVSLAELAELVAAYGGGDADALARDIRAMERGDCGPSAAELRGLWRVLRIVGMADLQHHQFTWWKAHRRDAAGAGRGR